MELTLVQMRKINELSDRVLYPEAVAFLTRLIQERECRPLPKTQVTGLLNVALSNRYTQLRDFIHHQRDRNWPANRRDIKTFYTELAQYFALMEQRRVRTEFLLVPSNLNAPQTLAATYEIMAPLAREFIQHLVAENNRLQAYKDQAFREHKKRR